MKTAMLAGATGLIGRHLLTLLIEDPYYQKVVVITRKPIQVSSKCENIVTNFDRLNEHYRKMVVDDVFCCLGTTMRVAGSKEAFRKVDFEYPMEMGRLAKINGAEKYLLVSALGAKKNSSVFYNHVKGEVEDAISMLRFSAYHIFRPSLLLGNRKEDRRSEHAAKIFFKMVGFLLPAKWKAIDARKVAAAMLHFAKQNSTGNFIHESGELQKLQST
jgi:uncharacterized protein YbjT (DUF2867 family)